MLGFVTFLWPLIAGICLYAGLLHLQNGLRRPMDRVHVLFGALALGMSVVVVANILLVSSRTADEYVRAAWIFSTAWTAVFALLPWFVTFYAEEPNRALAISLSAIYLVVFVANFFQPYSILVVAPPTLRQVEFPWGEYMTRSATAPTVWYSALWIPHFLTIGYLLYACIQLMRRGPRGRAWGLVLSAGPFAISLLINNLVRFGLLNFPYVAAPGFLALVVVMSTMLSRESRRSQSQMQVLLDNVPAIAYLKQADGKYIFVNRRFLQVYGLAEKMGADGVLGKTDVELFEAARATRNSEADRALLSGGATLESEELVEQDGVPRTYSTLRFALHDNDGSVYATCGISTDITERKAAADAVKTQADTLERRVARRTQELAQLNRELEAFAYSVSHDLRAPLTAVNGFAELLLREHAPKLDQTAQRYVNRIREGSLRMATLIQDLLGLSRVTQQTLERKAIDLAVLAEESLRTLRESEPTRRVSCTIPASLPANGDPKLLALALNNLLANAWKYTSKTAEAKIEVGALEQGGEHVYFVKDNGAGFNPQHADRLFRPFVRLHSESEFPGTGIGLATVARIVARHAGRIWAEARPGAGSTFFFTLPAGDEDFSATPSYVESLGA